MRVASNSNPGFPCSSDPHGEDNKVALAHSYIVIFQYDRNKYIFRKNLKVFWMRRGESKNNDIKEIKLRIFNDKC